MYLLSRRLIGKQTFHEEASKANRELTEAVEEWRNRDLSREKIKHIFVNGVIFEMRVNGSIENTSVLVAMGGNRG